MVAIPGSSVRTNYSTSSRCRSGKFRALLPSSGHAQRGGRRYPLNLQCSGSQNRQGNSASRSKGRWRLNASFCSRCCKPNVEMFLMQPQSGRTEGDWLTTSRENRPHLRQFRKTRPDFARNVAKCWSRRPPRAAARPEKDTWFAQTIQHARRRSQLFGL